MGEPLGGYTIGKKVSCTVYREPDGKGGFKWLVRPITKQEKGGSIMGVCEIPCRVCGEPTTHHTTKLCDGCWEVEHRLEHFLSFPQGLVKVEEELNRIRAGEKTSWWGIFRNAFLSLANSLLDQAIADYEMGGAEDFDIINRHLNWTFKDINTILDSYGLPALMFPEFENGEKWNEISREELGLSKM